MAVASAAAVQSAAASGQSVARLACCPRWLRVKEAYVQRVKNRFSSHQEVGESKSLHVLAKSHLEFPLSADERVDLGVDLSVYFRLAGMNDLLNLGSSLIA